LKAADLGSMKSDVKSVDVAIIIGCTSIESVFGYPLLKKREPSRGELFALPLDIFEN
jgi:hypothetical protein